MNSYFHLKYIFIFLPVLIIIYNFIPKKIKPLVLLIASYIFFYIISGKLIIFIILSSLSIYLAGLLMDKKNKERDRKLSETAKEYKKDVKEKYKRKKKLILVLTIIFNVIFLFIFKYLGFFTTIINDLLSLFKVNYSFRIIKLLAPIGISFYTLEAISYLVDVYNEKVEASKNILKVMLYLTFFPTIMEGPIVKFSDIKDSLYNGSKITYHNFCSGYKRIIFGLFKKYLIVDRLNVFVKLAFDNYLNYSGLTLAIGVIFYTILLYMDFSGTMDIVIGTGEIFDIKIPENFRQPFFSKNISEFWSRWHISLGLWFKNYIFYPVSLSKGVKKLSSNIKKKFGNRVSSLLMGAIALFAVWSLNGLWHGAGFTFIFFGYYHFTLILLGNIFEPYIVKICQKLRVNRENKIYKFLQIIKTCCLVFIGELFFRADTLNTGFGILKRIITKFSFRSFSLEIFTLGLDIKDFIVAFLALVVIFIISILKEKKINIRESLNKKNIVLRWALYYALILAIIVFGAYGAGYAPLDPIYADF